MNWVFEPPTPQAYAEVGDKLGHVWVSDPACRYACGTVSVLGARNAYHHAISVIVGVRITPFDGINARGIREICVQVEKEQNEVYTCRQIIERLLTGEYVMSDFMDFDEKERQSYIQNQAQPATRLEVAARLYGDGLAAKIVATMNNGNFTEEIFAMLRPQAQEPMMTRFILDWVAKNGLD